MNAPKVPGFTGLRVHWVKIMIFLWCSTKNLKCLIDPLCGSVKIGNSFPRWWDFRDWAYWEERTVTLPYTVSSSFCVPLNPGTQTKGLLLKMKIKALETTTIFLFEHYLYHDPFMLNTIFTLFFTGERVKNLQRKRNQKYVGNNFALRFRIFLLVSFLYLNDFKLLPSMVFMHSNKSLGCRKKHIKFV